MIDQNWIYVGALLNLIGSVTYVVATIKGKTSPNRVTWFLWALAPLVAYGAMLGEGVSPLDGLMTFMVGFGPLLIFIASFFNKKSVWKITRFDMICGALSLLGLVGWLLTRTGSVAIFFSLLADGLALLPTLAKTWKAPETENYVVFLNGAISAAITMLALQVYDFEHMAFPVYIFIVCALMFVLIKFKIGPKVTRRLGLES
jgi:hypothetical protein